MRSLNKLWLEWLYARLQGSIVARTTLAILVLSMFLGLTFASIMSASVERGEQNRAQIRLQQLLVTVESTAQIACYIKDRRLAGEIAQGLSRNPGVSGVRITSDSVTLAQVGETPSTQGRGVKGSVIARRLYAPDDADEVVGQVALFVDRAAIHAEAASYSRAAILAMGVQAALVAAGVALAVYFFSTRPIRAVSNELHRIRFDTGARLHVPFINRLDEIGSLVSDVNEVLTTERELRVAREAAERKMRLIFEKAETGIFVLHDCGILESWNPAFVRLLRLTPEQLPQSGVTRLQQLLAPHASRLIELIDQCLTTGQSNDLDLEFPRDGDSHAGWIEISLNPIGRTELQGVVNDITERKQGELAAQELATHAQELATRDSLTALLNRRGLDTGLGAAFSRHSPGSVPELALLHIDLDYFKEVNDGYGHEGGDRVLRHVATILQHNARRGDLIARPGGDEFVVALIGIADRSKAEEIANTIVGEIQLPIDIGGHDVRVGASIGIAFTSGQDDSPDALMRRADEAMYGAKRAGGGQVYLAAMPTTPHTSAVA
ncbi:MAG: diguanylate cyclase domain-containing protein [Steroidobacteraceae bacterium]